MKYDVVSIGEPVIDFYSATSEKGLVYEAHPGGGCANVLAEVCALGGTAALLGVVGNDIFGDFLIKEIEEVGICADEIARTSEKRTGIGFILLGENGERSFLHYENYHVKTSLWNEHAEKAIENCEIFHYTSVSLVDSQQREESLRGVGLAKKLGKAVSFDVNYRKAMWEDPSFARKLFWECIQDADIVKLSEEEQIFLCGTDDCEKASRMLKAGKEKIVLISLGAKGSFASCGENSWLVEAKTVEAKDTTGCGDAFVGAVLAHLLPWIREGRWKNIPVNEMKRILEISNGAGALCATRRGSLNVMPSRREIEDFLMRGRVQ